jgi:hypothetical protein
VKQHPLDVQIQTIARDGTGDTQITSGSPPSGTPAWSPLGAKIAYARGNSLYVANPDGGGAAPILNWSDKVGAISWSPDGNKLAVELHTCEAAECRYDIYTVGSDGSGLFDVTPDLVEERNPSWSPDGNKIAFDTPRQGSYDIWTVAPDGTGLTRLTTNDTAAETDPDWSPDGARISYVGNGEEIVIANADGTGIQSLGRAADFNSDTDPAWSPDGWFIAFVHEIPNQGCVGVRRAIFVAYAQRNGARTQVSTPPPVGQECSADGKPAWQPLPGSFVRPRGATPMRIPLVPAFRRCTSPNTSHGAPLSFGSCSPPAQVSDSLTVGTPEANGLRGTSVGSLVLRVKAGDRSTPPNEADVFVDFLLTDVLRQGTLTPYDGELWITLHLRITDLNNYGGPSDAGDPATGDGTLQAAVQCYPSGGSGRCELHSSVNAITYSYNTIVEGRRSLWEIDQVEVYEPGADGTFGTGDERPFVVQGVFVP